MKLLHVSPSYYPAFKFGGPIQSVHLLNVELAKQGVIVDVFSTNAGLLGDNSIKLKEWNERSGIRIKYFPFVGYEHYNFSISMLVALFKSVQKYEVVHITAVWNFPVLATCMACWWHKVPYIISPRGTIYPETINIKSALFKKTYYLLFAQKCLAKASSIHYTSKDEKDSVEKYLGLTNGVVIANGIDLSEFGQTTSQNIAQNPKPYMLFLGRINKKKGLDILFEAFAKLTIIHPDLTLFIVGHDNDGYQMELEKLATDLNITPKIKFTGPLQGTEKVNMYRNATLFVLSSYSENFGMSVVEAMACGCPVVISDKVGIADHIAAKQAGIVVQTNAESICKGIRLLIEDPLLRTSIALNGLQTAQSDYGIQCVASAFVKLYKQFMVAKR